MKALYFFLAMMSTLVSTSQMVDIAFYYHKDTNPGSFEFNTYKPELDHSDASKLIAVSKSENMCIPEFKKFGLYEGLVEKLKDELLVVHSYKLLKETSRIDPEVHQSYNGLIDDKSIELVRNAQDGDQYILYDILVKNEQGMVFRIPLVIRATIKAKTL